ncbi:SDR family oxidoreductase [Microcella sp.]|uniref:SDR family oxidoreductase n=1 Tax=Microcella sp. TaxID=1913979 RepID=UPI00256C012D|nr:NAD(P)H-binding protein [Microcella sp.]MBX9471000.1 NAD(P)H-binding protein [Microcella sp.]
MTLLITGGTGTLGRPTVDALRAAGVEPRILSRRPGSAHAIADLQSGVGLPEALAGVETVLHLATNRRSDARATQRLLQAARAAGVQHLVYLSIVGVDAVPLGYYRAKLACEHLVAESGVPFTILRATQFHDFVGGFFSAQRRLPRLITLDVPFQPISTAAVAERLVSLVTAAPVHGRVDDLGGPEVLPMAELARQWVRARGASTEAAERRVVEWHLPGALAAAYRAGLHTTGQPGPGIRFADWAATRDGQ